MVYENLKRQMPDATYMYCDVTPEEVDTITQTYWRIPVGTLSCIGTQEPEASLIHRAVPNDSVQE